jgi:preprotein translocase subunit SecD
MEVMAALDRDEPVVRLRLGARAANILARTAEQSGGPWLAFLLESQVASVVMVRAPIRTDVVQLSGGLTVEAARNLAALLRVGSPSPPMRIVEEREVPPVPRS